MDPVALPFGLPETNEPKSSGMKGCVSRGDRNEWSLLSDCVTVLGLEVRSLS